MTASRAHLFRDIRLYELACQLAENDGRLIPDEDSTKIDVRVPQKLVKQIDAEYEGRGHTSRSEAIRDALRAWVDPPIRLSEAVLEDLETSRKQRERGETYSLDGVADKYGVDIDE
ncbi:ribbon-helix-helix domain-containing protein [Haloarcula onubensis]|uniref:Ribbon-helix-helix domain-containing protein n=1 Tax=Haloarcula onubensis TaxID=2950539 RepID=A0ABU2FUQ1_9EURY|nr:ribbon-helix-helix domain-containing protein [Halomicroarcula sp. S3CR25-11]MDS0284489.1 ribbon-helix-helix domain-containing protein [Halomicroarcula sp. S3CR25-11]